MSGLEFHIEPSFGDPDTRARLVLKCGNSASGECRFPLWRKAASGVTWEWDGNVERPTIRPSIQCNHGCGRHFTLTNGEAT